MTIEIRELVIEARISDSEGSSTKSLAEEIAKNREEEARWVELISKMVVEQLREERGV
ncbi:DUF5908 family protein [Enterobacter roggenkampii]|uniref:DUF5908 family protein n=1 Tax=Enterobacter roggenkampii TaxID=1812935 RepID=UPI000A40F63E|nr:DUF5908 family protein [Enterobacter roggenkampii]QWZ75381.1 hypothetical protein I6L60_23085 [Enterobacter roggenkampii]QWZ75470.1 hypothetical protein I6L60_23170 [Enterobacter roggenkampii]